MGYQILVLILPFITTPYISRVLGADGVGAFGYTESISQYFVLFGCIGLNLYGQREIAYCRKSKEERSRVFWELLILRIITISIVIVIFCFTACQSEKYGRLFSIEIIEIVASMVDISWFFQGVEDFKKIVIRNALVKLSGVVLIFTLVKNREDLSIYTFIYVITLFLGNVSMWFYISKYIKKIEYDTLKVTRHIRLALILFIPQIATNMYNLLDKSMIGYLTQSDAEVAYYEQAQKIMKMVLSIPTALGTVMLPRIANMFGEGRREEIKEYLYKSINFVCLLAFPLCMGLCGISKGFVPWFFGNGYNKVVNNLIILSPIIIIVGISNVIGVQYLLPTGKQRQYTCSVIMGTVVNFLLNIVAIPLLLSAGAALASIVAELSVTIFQLIMVRKEFNFGYVLNKNYKYIISSAIVYLVVFLLSGVLGNGRMIATVLEVFVGGIIYVIVLLLMKDEMIYNFIIKAK